MTGLDKIVQQIQSEARQAAEKTISDARRQAETITDEARQKAQTQCAAIKTQSKSDAANALSAAESAAQLAKRRAILAAKQQIINETISKAQSSLYDLPDAQYFELILKMVKKYARDGEGEIIFNDKDKKRLPPDFSKSLGQKLAVSAQTRDMDGGFVLTYGGIEENCSFEALFYAAHEQLQDKVSELLFS